MAPPELRPGIAKIDPYVPGKSKVSGFARTIKLSSNEGALGPSPRAVEAVIKLAREIHRYPDGAAVALREAIGKRHGLDPARIVCGTGSDEIIALLCRAYAGPGDEVLYSQYGFQMFSLGALAAGATPVIAAEKDLCTDVDALLKAANAKTKLCFVANPNNPTGTYIPASEMKRLRDGLPKSCLLVVDSAYAEYVSRNDYSAGVELVDQRDDVIMLRTFSKMYALGGMRVGWAYGHPATIDALNRIRGVFSVALPSQAAAIASLEDTAFTDLCRAHNDMWLPWFTDELRKLGLKVTDSVANFVLIEFPKSGKTAAAAEKFLNGKGIIPRGLGGYNLPDHLRITVGLEEELRAVIAALREFLS